MKTTINFTADNIKTLKNLVKNTGKLHQNEKESVFGHVLLSVTEYNRVQASLVVKNNGYITTEFKPGSFETGNKKEILVPADFIKGIAIPKGKNEVRSLQFDSRDTFYFNDGIMSKAEKTLDTDYPLPPNPGELTTLMALRKDTLDKLKSAHLSIATSESRPVLNGVNLTNDKLVSTDSHRLFYAAIHDRVNEGDIVIPGDLVKALENVEERGSFFGVLKYSKTDIYSEWVVAETLNNTYYFQAQPGNYPDTSKLMPDDFMLEFELSDLSTFKKTLQECYKMVKKDKNAPVTIAYDGKGKIQLIANGEKSKIEQDFTVKSSSDEDFKICFSCKYMLDALQQIGTTSHIDFKFTGTFRPFILVGDNKDLTALILPVRVYNS